MTSVGLMLYDLQCYILSSSVQVPIFIPATSNTDANTTSPNDPTHANQDCSSNAVSERTFDSRLHETAEDINDDKSAEPAIASDTASYSSQRFCEPLAALTNPDQKGTADENALPSCSDALEEVAATNAIATTFNDATDLRTPCLGDTPDVLKQAVVDKLIPIIERLSSDGQASAMAALMELSKSTSKELPDLLSATTTDDIMVLFRFLSELADEDAASAKAAASSSAAISSGTHKAKKRKPKR